MAHANVVAQLAEAVKYKAQVTLEAAVETAQHAAGPGGPAATVCALKCLHHGGSCSWKRWNGPPKQGRWRSSKVGMVTALLYM
jgi:hypothetical protein